VYQDLSSSARILRSFQGDFSAVSGPNSPSDGDDSPSGEGWDPASRRAEATPSCRKSFLVASSSV